MRESSPDPSYEGVSSRVSLCAVSVSREQCVLILIPMSICCVKPHTLKSLKEQWHANLEWVKYHDSRRHLHPGSRTARKKYKETMTAIEDMVKDGQYQAPEE